MPSRSIFYYFFLPLVLHIRRLPLFLRCSDVYQCQYNGHALAIVGEHALRLKITCRDEVTSSRCEQTTGSGPRAVNWLRVDGCAVVQYAPNYASRGTAPKEQPTAVHITAERASSIAPILLHIEGNGS